MPRGNFIEGEKQSWIKKSFDVQSSGWTEIVSIEIYRWNNQIRQNPKVVLTSTFDWIKERQSMLN